MVDPDRLLAAYETARCDLLAESTSDGHWQGCPSSSALSTASAISALAIVERHAPTVAGRIVDEQRECALSELIMGSLRWLARRQNADGGWGDTDSSPSNLAATLAVRAAFALTCVPAKHPGLLERADAYIAAQGGVRGLKRRYAAEKTLVGSLLANCALAGLIDWNQVPAWPFELVCVPPRFRRFLRLPVASYGVPLLIAVGQTRHVHKRPANPLASVIRSATLDKSLDVLTAMQSTSGGFLEAVPWTSIVVMSLASMGRADHPIVRGGAEFLLSTVRPDGSWPIEPNAAVQDTARAVGALAGAAENLSEVHCLEWLLDRQQRAAHPVTGAQPGGWSSGDFPGCVPEVSTTADTLSALAALERAGGHASGQVLPAASAAIRWLLDMQNADGGWPSFDKDRRASPSDTSATDVTARALRALGACRTMLDTSGRTHAERQELDPRLGWAIEAGLRYLAAAQQRSGAWQPLWSGHQLRPQQDNPVYGTSEVLLALRDLDRLDSPPPRRALDWLIAQQHTDGSFGGASPGREAGEGSNNRQRPAATGSIEETALATEALLTCGQAQAHEDAVRKALRFLVDAVEANRHTETAAIHFRYWRLWYHERLQPLSAVVSCLGHAVRRLLPQAPVRPMVHQVRR